MKEDMKLNNITRADAGDVIVLDDGVIIEFNSENKEQKVGNIILPHNTQYRVADAATVVKVGPGTSQVTMQVVEGDVVLVQPNPQQWALPLTISGKECYLISQAKIMLVKKPSAKRGGCGTGTCDCKA
jgi:co-chaperonin GroES (HSP10)